MCYYVKKCHENGQTSFHTKCRKCLECCQERAREWGLRNMLEAEQHTTGCFITLTYDEEHNPVILVKKHLQDFKKRLRKHLKETKIKTFDCGEYGELNYRPHFHLLIHGFDFPDKYEERKSDKGHPIYNSPILEKLWGRGLVTVQDITMNSAAYCALYAAKPTKDLPEELQEYPEFNTMSKSLGMQKLLANMETYLLTDEIFFDGKKYRIPQTALNKYFAPEIEYRKNARKYGWNAHPEMVQLRPREIILAELKEKRRQQGSVSWEERTLTLPAEEMYSQKRYRSENRQRRRQKPL